MEHTIKHDWDESSVAALFELPFNDLLFQAHSTHRQFFNPNQIQLSALLSIKTGACPEDCAYCPQSGHYNTGVKTEKLMAVEDIVEQAKAAKAQGASRFCMGAAWRSPPANQMEKLKTIIREVKALGLETCMTLGMLDQQEARELEQAGLEFYNHNVDTSPEFYDKIITTRVYQDRLDTLENVRNSGMRVCCGGIVGMGEARTDRINMLRTLANLPEHPESVPINMLIPIPGTPLGDYPPLDHFEFIRTVAVARILMPQSFVRLSAGRVDLSPQSQALCFFAGANSIHFCEKLLVTDNVEVDADLALMKELGITPLQYESLSTCHDEV